MSPASNKKYDKSYFDRWYRNSTHERNSHALLERKVHLAVSLAEYYLERPIRSVLDVGCGEAVWRSPLLKLRPKLEYRGVDSSEYAVSRFGRSRNIAFASFGQLEQLRFDAPVDLLVCSDVIHYVPDTELKRGLKGFSELCGGLAFLELWSMEDDIVGDKVGFIERPAAWYRKQFAKAGFVPSGSHSYLSASLHAAAASLEVLR
ncbi:MAG: class I SAM-dependent methyltransferase [Arenimonas sp.]